MAWQSSRSDGADAEAARGGASPPGAVSRSFEGLLQELDDVRARLLEQHRLELDHHRRASSKPASEGDGEARRRGNSGPSTFTSGSCEEEEQEEEEQEEEGVMSPASLGDRSIAVASSSDLGGPRAGPVLGPECVPVERRISSSDRFLLLDSWKDKGSTTMLKDLQPAPRSKRVVSSASKEVPSSKTAEGDGEIVFSSVGRLHGFVLHPQSPVVVAWTILSLVLIAYDTLTVPLYTFYKFEQFPTLIGILDWIPRIFWTIDIPMSSLTGFYKAGYVELRPANVFRAYLMSWFLFDVLVVSTDWLVIAVTDQTALTAVPVLRGLRFVRVLRLLRLGRLVHLINEVLLYASDGVMILVVILKLTLGLCISIHLVASLWVGLGTISGSGWVHQEPLMDSASLSAQYVVSVNWVVTQLQGTSSVEPHTIPEMLFQILVLLGANAFVAIFIASTVQAMMALTDAQTLQMQYICRRYLRRRNISPELSYKLQLHFGKSGMRSRTTAQDGHEVENKLVESLPLVLQQQLYEEVRLPLLSSTRLFRTQGLANYRMLRQLCCDAISGLFMLPGELVFTFGDSCTRTLIVESGSCAYVLAEDRGEEGVCAVPPALCPVSSEDSREPRASRPRLQGHSSRRSRESLTSVAVQTVFLHRGQCLCEAALWTRWTNVGELSSEGDCSMLSLGQADFVSIVSHYEFCYMTALKYASCYIIWLNDRMAERELSDLLDAPKDLLEYAEVPLDTGSPFVFISHFKEEAGSDAALMDEGITRIIKSDPHHPAFRLEAPTFLDSNNLDDIRLLRSVVRSSQNLLLLLTDRVLERPWVLIEVVTAIQSGVPIQLVQIQRPGIDFRFPTEGDIKRIAAGKGLSSHAKAVLKAENITSSDIEAIGQIFGKIALPFSPHRSLTVRQAELSDILGRCEFSTHPRQGTPA